MENTLSDKQRAILRAYNINFAVFKMVLSAVLTSPNFQSEDDFVRLYTDYTEHINEYFESIADWAEDYFQDFSIDRHRFQLRSRGRDVTSPFTKPPFNTQVIVAYKNADEIFFISAMWDISEKWVTTDKYEEVVYEVVGWFDPPKI